MKVQFKLENFEGPLDLLLHLIDEAEVDIYDIPIRQITDQYMLYLRTMQQLELEVTSEFIVMASTLLKIKSQMLLPKPPLSEDGLEREEELDPREELVRRLLEYRKYKYVAEHLRERELERSQIFTRAPLDLAPYAPQVKENPLKGIHAADIISAFQNTLKKFAHRERVTKIHRDEISVKDCMLDIVATLDHNGGKILFSRLFDDHADREDIVVTFLAVLELMKRGQIHCYQYALFEDIVIQLREGGIDRNEHTEDQIYY